VRALVQRASRARVTVDDRATGEIGRGLVVLVGVTHDDREGDADWLARRIAGLRVFPEGEKPMQLDVREVGGACLVVPQFTLYGDTRRGRRPDFVAAAAPQHAEPLIERFCATLATEGVVVARGVFQAHMQVELTNDGPVTLMVESPRGGGEGA
jgi:D-tyrosyl-tRNA(Tyr) deacylase